MAKILDPNQLRLMHNNHVSLKAEAPTNQAHVEPTSTLSTEEEQMLHGQGLFHGSKAHLLSEKLEVLGDAITRRAWVEAKIYDGDARQLGASKKQLSQLYSDHLKEAITRSASTEELEELQLNLELLGASLDDLNNAFQVGSHILHTKRLKL